MLPGKGPGLFPAAILVLGSVFFQNLCLKPANVGDTHIQSLYIHFPFGSEPSIYLSPCVKENKTS